MWSVQLVLCSVVRYSSLSVIWNLTVLFPDLWFQVQFFSLATDTLLLLNVLLTAGKYHTRTKFDGVVVSCRLAPTDRTWNLCLFYLYVQHSEMMVRAGHLEAPLCFWRREFSLLLIAFVTTETVILLFFTWLLLCVLSGSGRNVPSKVFLLVCKDF
jgi:hypothetical protein